MTPPTPSRNRQRRLLVLIALIFFGPLAVAFYLYYGPGGWRPAGHVNHGELIDPPRPLPALSLPRVGEAPAAARATDPRFLMRKWTLLFVGPGACTEQCRGELYKTRQVRTALNRDMGRVQRVFIAQGECCDFAYLRSEQADLITVQGTDAAAPLLALLPDAGGVPAAAQRVYLIDPLGNLMMWYAADATPKGMLEDLKRLLGLSHVG